MSNYIQERMMNAYARVIESEKIEAALKGIEEKLREIELLTKDELTLLTQLRQGNATEITIKLKDGKPDRMEVTQDIKKDVEARLMETFTKHEYSDVTYKVTDGKMINFKKTTKIKLNEKE